jgi:hypothetical protein
MQLNTKSMLLLSLLAGGSATAQAHSFFDDVNYIVGASLGYTTYSFPAKLDHDLNFPTANLLLAANKNKWQLSVNAGGSFDDADISEEEDTGKASREDLDITLAYRIDKNWEVFAGYKDGETKLSFVPRDIEDSDYTKSRESYAGKGPYIGASYAWRFEKAGSLTFSLAYADLDATNTFAANTDEEEIDEEPEFDDLTGKVKGDTTGFSYGVSWTMPLSKSLLFQAKFKINDYQQDIKFDGVRYKDIDEELNSLTIGLAYIL